MYYQKTGMPEENELVLCTVTNVQFNSVFCKLDEYNKTGMIHISEVSPGRIRNIRDYVQEGKKIVCKILRIDDEKGHIDLSLRRATDNQRRAKNAELKQELKAEKLLEYFAKQEKLDMAKLYAEVSAPLLQEYEYLHTAFDDVVSGELDLEQLNVPHAKGLAVLIKEKIAAANVTIKGVFTVNTFHELGVDAVKEALAKAQAVDAQKIDIRYLGNGRYRMVVSGSDYDEIEPVATAAVKAAEAVIKEKGPGQALFARDD